MPFYTNNKFKGFYPIGTAAVVIAESQQQAADVLTRALAELGLGPAEVEDMERLPVYYGSVRILNTGDY